MFEHLLVSHPENSIVLVTINRPRQFNSLARPTFNELSEAFSQYEASADRALILTGSGRFFCFGADFTEFQDRSQLPALLQSFQDLILKIHRCPKPTIASLNGHATGAGLDLALACDFRFAQEKSKLGEAYIGMGLVSDGGGSGFLPKMIGTARATQMLLTGESIEAPEAKTWGLVHQVWNSEELSAKTLEFARNLASKPETALRLMKKLIRENAGADLETGLKNERNAQLECFEDPQHQEIVREFLAKRQRSTS